MGKSIVIWPVSIILILLTTAFLSAVYDKRDNENNNRVHAAKDETATFIREMADARMMDTEEGKLARDRGTTDAIKQYGEWMITDQAIILKALQSLASAKGVSLPDKLSREKAEGLADLKKEQGVDFDKKFMKMIVIDHKRDIKAFREAAESEDAAVKTFASKFLPVIESHLVKIEEIKDAE